MRSRNVKPAFFKNDALAELCPLTRLFFIGLWTAADYKGDIHFRPKRLKAEILPYDDVDVEKLAISLDKSRFIRFYSVQGEKYIHITNFLKHQNPHKNEREKGSDIPPFDEKHLQAVDSKGLAINLDKNGTNHDENETNPADSCSLIPDSCSLIPEYYCIELPLNTGIHRITLDEVDEYKRLYPAVDVDQAIRLMKGWLDGNKARRKTKSGIKRFINAWLSKEQDRGGRSKTLNQESEMSQLERVAAKLIQEAEGGNTNRIQTVPKIDSN